MTDHVYNEMRKKVDIPSLTKKEFTVSEVDNNIHRHLGSRQLIHLTAEEVNEVLDECDVPLPEFLFRYGNNETSYDPTPYIDVTEWYGTSDYLGSSNVFIPTLNYFGHVKTNRAEFFMNVFNGRNADIHIGIIQKKINKVKPEDLPSGNFEFGFNAPGKIPYTVFDETRYNPKASINKYLFRFPVLSINVPYEYYSIQDIPENIYTWDIDSNEYRFADKSTEKVMTMFDDICRNGIQMPLFMQIAQGKIVSASDDNYIALLIAQYLKLPSIPVTLYMMKNTSESKLLQSLRHCDVVNSYIDDYNVGSEEWCMATDLCFPYMIFFDSRYASREGKTITIGDRSVFEPAYRADKDREVVPMEEMNQTDEYLYAIPQEGEKAKVEERSEDDIAVEELHAKLRAEAEAKADETLVSYLKKIGIDLDSEE